MSELTIYPEAFLNRMKNILGDEYDAFIQSLDESSPTSIRLNPFKYVVGQATNNSSALVGRLTNEYLNTEEKIPWCENGRYLKERPSFTFDPLFHAGTYYVQEASSMFIEQAWKQINPKNEAVRVLDMCAAPGGKSSHLLSLMNEESLLVSNEIIPNRNKTLQQNIVKWGTANCIVTQNKPEDFSALEDFFDIILIDAPCSGEGLFRKDKDAIDEWSEKNVELCSIRQKEILKHAVACLKHGGFIIYSTCTFEEAENDKQIAELGMLNAELEIQDFGQVKTKYGYQFYPYKIKGEGFYISVVKKEGEFGNQKSEIRNQNKQSTIHNQFLREAEKFHEHTKNDMLFAIPQSIYSDFLFLESQFYIRHAGIFMGTCLSGRQATKGKDFLPSHDLALSNYIKQDLPSVELNYDDAIIYLRCETPKIKTEHRGWCLVKYQNQNLGWIKAMEGRINNYFPKELRILKR